MSTSSQRQISLRLLASPLFIMWKSKRFFAAVFLSAMCILFAVYTLYWTDTRDTLHHHHPHQHHHHHHPRLNLNLSPAEDVSSAHRLNGSHDTQKKQARGSAGTPLLRILVLTYKRAKSLERCLASLNAAEYDGERVAVDIHVDRGKDDKVHNDTLRAASSFVFKHGPVRVFVRPRHGGVVGQWLASWRVPQDNASEIALFVEDDLTLSPYFARWLRRVHEKYDGYPGISGYSLQGESVCHALGADRMLHGPAGQSVFLYPVLGSWGFSPHTDRWREFMRWYHEASQDPKFVPVVAGLKPSLWYQSFVQSGRTDTMWTMWHIYYTHKNQQYTVYPQLAGRQGLSFNWKEPGEHYAKTVMGKGLQAHLMQAWREEDVRLPEKLLIVDAKGKVTGQKMSASGLE